MTVNLATQLGSIFRDELDLGGALGTLAAAPLDEPAAARIRRIVVNASPAVRIAMHRRIAPASSAAGDSANSPLCGTDHKGLRSTSRMVDRSLERRGAQA